MQRSGQRSGPKLSLNGIRAFEAAARFRSLKHAAAELGVTQSAVSHQVRQLEDGLGVRLFLRRSNGVDLTDEGERLFLGVGAAIATIARAQQTVRQGAAQVTLRVSPSLAYRWLIPRLDVYRRAFPKISMRLETSRAPHVLEPGVDIGITYARNGAAATDATLFLADRVRPVVSPKLLAEHGRGSRALRIQTAPLLSAAADDWDWRHWAQAHGIAFADLGIRHRFDVDHAAVEACAAGMGVYLATEFMIDRELDSGALVPLCGYEALHMGAYWIRTASPSRPAVRRLADWLAATARESETPDRGPSNVAGGRLRRPNM